MGEGESEPKLRQFKDLSLDERFDALMAVVFEDPPEEDLVEWIGLPPNTKAEVVPEKVKQLRTKRAEKISQLRAEGKAPPSADETCRRIGIDPGVPHDVIIGNALNKIPGFNDRSK